MQKVFSTTLTSKEIECTGREMVDPEGKGSTQLGTREK